MENEFKLHYDPNDKLFSRWEALLSTSNGSFFQSPNAYKFFQNAGIDNFFIALESNRQLKCLVIGIIQKESGILSSYLSRRAIIYGGPLLIENIKSEELTVFLSALKLYLNKKAIYIESRNLNDFSIHKRSFKENGFTYIPHLNFQVDCTNELLIKKNISRSKIHQINKSLKSGAEIIEATSIEEVKEYYKILRNLYSTKIKTPLFHEKFFIEFFYQDIGKYILVKWQGKIVGGIMCPIYKNKVVYEWFKCDDGVKHYGLYTSVLATWAGIQYASTNGIRYFDFLGAGAPGKEYGVRTFKASFGGELIENGRFLYICKPLLYQIGKMGVKAMKMLK